MPNVNKAIVMAYWAMTQKLRISLMVEVLRHLAWLLLSSGKTRLLKNVKRLQSGTESAPATV